MLYGLLADVVVLFHFAFVVFAVAGGLLALRWRKIVFFHLPVVLWAAWVEFAGWLCPLTPLENWLRRKAGGEGYRGDFIEHYLLPILYPAGLTRTIQIGLGVLVITLNLLIYWFVLTRSRSPQGMKTRRKSQGEQ